MNKLTEDKSIEKKNIDFFSNNLNYQNNVGKIDTYQILFNKKDLDLFDSSRLN